MNRAFPVVHPKLRVWIKLVESLKKKRRDNIRFINLFFLTWIC